jgi:hypothetical protein
MDCFVAEFIIGPAKGRTRWLLAMTGRETPIAAASRCNFQWWVRIFGRNRNRRARYCGRPAFTRFRNNGRRPLICPTRQVAFSNAGGRLLLCMGLFSIFGSANLRRGVLQRHPQLCRQRHGAIPRWFAMLSYSPGSRAQCRSATERWPQTDAKSLQAKQMLAEHREIAPYDPSRDPRTGRTSQRLDRWDGVPLTG